MKFAKIFLICMGILFILLLGKKFTTQSPIIEKNVVTSVTPSQPTQSDKISKGKTPTIPFKVPAGFTIHVFAENLGSPRDLAFSENGTLLISIPSRNEIVALPDKNNDGVADENKIVIDSEKYAHGLAFLGNKLFIAEVDKVVRYNWDEENLSATKDKTLFSIPATQGHTNRTLILDKTGTLYVSVGSTCNVCKESSNFAATVLISNANGDNPRVFAKGLRNAPFLAFKPDTQELWVTEMGRDNLGDNIPPDEIDILADGKDYGWPYCYGNKVHDNAFDLIGMHSCSNTQTPTYEIPAHSAPLGLAFINSPQFPPDWQNDLLVSYHGSWNRSVPTGYKVVHMKVSGSTITSSEDFLTGFSQGSDALGRPVDLIFDKAGSLYISDDKAGKIYILQKQE